MRGGARGNTATIVVTSGIGVVDSCAVLVLSLAVALAPLLSGPEPLMLGAS